MNTKAQPATSLQATSLGFGALLLGLLLTQAG